MTGQTERGDFQVTCTRKCTTPQGQTLIAIGGHDGEDHWLIPIDMAIAWIENRTARFFTAANGQFVWLTVRTYESGRKTLATEADDATTSFLLILPDCP